MEVAVIQTHEDGRREATVLVTAPNEHSVKLGAPFLYRYLRTTRRKDAPPGFEFSVLERDERLKIEGMLR